MSKKPQPVVEIKRTKNLTIKAPVQEPEPIDVDEDFDEDGDEEDGLSLDEKKKQFGEVFTPPELVNEILDNLPKDLWNDPSKTWLDNSAGAGAFLIEVKRRLMEGLKDWEPDAVKREAHILDKQIYGVELQEDNWQQCRRNLGLTPKGNDGNIVCADGLTYNYNFEKNSKGGYVMGDSTLENLVEMPLTTVTENTEPSIKKKEVVEVADTGDMFDWG